MLGQAADVAAASEQSALAMREAAQTAAGLIRAIEEARSEVEPSAEIANRAASQAGHAVETTAPLSHHAKAIESSLGLIREIGKASCRESVWQYVERAEGAGSLKKKEN